MLKKVIFAAALALGFVTSFNVGAASDPPVVGAQCTGWDCEPRCQGNPDC
jgi:hypothetical protein